MQRFNSEKQDERVNTINNSLGLYIHIPFCAAKCRYCDFNSHIQKDGEAERYVKAICSEIKNYGEKTKEKVVDTIFFGGGTPTVLPPDKLVHILDEVKSYFSVTEDCEITTECNPGTIDLNGLMLLRENGFNRLSFGMQSADDKELKMLGRIHSFEECKDAVKNAKSAGFDNISVDLMFGLPNQTEDSFKQSLQAAIDLKTQHISAYALKIEEGTDFYLSGISVADDDLSRNMYDTAVEVLKNYGFCRYEISNFAIPGYESRHNLKYWRCNDYIGMGAGAYSCFNGQRYSNPYSTEEYIFLALSNTLPKEGLSDLSEFDKMSEFVYLGLRLKSGICEDEFLNRFNRKITNVFSDELEKNYRRGTLLNKDGRIFIPDEYMYVSSAIMSDFV